MKHLLRRFNREVLSRFGYRIIRYYPQKPFSIFEQAVDLRVAQGKSCRFVQVGAYDGVTLDPLRPLILRHGLSGTLVEPQPTAFEALQALYAEDPNIQLLEVAITKTRGPVELIAPVAEHQPIRQGGASIKPGGTQCLKNYKRAGVKLETITVAGITVSDLLEQHAGAVDVLQIDVEGMDWVVLQAFLDAGIRPAIVQFEHIHLSQAEHRAYDERLFEEGYRYLREGINTIALKEPACTTPEADAKKR